MSENPNDHNLPDDYFFVTESWGSRFYKVYRKEMTYNAAKTQCESDGAFLAIPRSKAENNYISDLIKGHNHKGIWIGINDIDQEGLFVAVDGSNITYTNWDSGEPSNAHNEDAVIIHPDRNWVGSHREHTWNDIDVNARMIFVCSLRIRGKSKISLNKK